MTASRSASAEITPRSWVIISTARPRSRRSRSSSRRMPACTVTSSAVVGSSAMSSFGSHGQRRGDRDALPHAAGELVRVAAPAPGAGRGCGPRPAAPRPGARRLLAQPVVVAQVLGELALDGEHRVQRRHRVLGTMATSLPRTSRSSRSGSAEQLPPGEADRAGVRAPCGSKPRVPARSSSCRCRTRRRGRALARAHAAGRRRRRRAACRRDRRGSSIRRSSISSSEVRRTPVIRGGRARCAGRGRHAGCRRGS